MNKNVKALEQAQWAFESKGHADRETKVNRAVELAQWGFFSVSHISDFTGLPNRQVREFIGEVDGLGGKMHGDSIKHILEVIHMRENGFTDDFATQRAIEAGCSQRILARFAEMSQTMVALQWKRVTR